MHLAAVRLGFLLVSLVASLHSAAATRYWTLTGVGLSDGSHASGYFSYDDLTLAISNWNVQIDAAFSVVPGFVYVPGNSTATVVATPGGGEPTILLSAAMGVPERASAVRELRLTPVRALDGSNAFVLLSTASSREDFRYLLTPNSVEPRLVFRLVSTGSLIVTQQPPPVVSVHVDEFYHPGLDHYFITADEEEKHILDAKAHTGWQRTGESFKAYAKGSNTDGTISPVCRYYSPPLICSTYYYYYDYVCTRGADSHFLSAEAGECLNPLFDYSGFWQQERDNAFQIDLPDKTTGACPTGTIPVYRLWNQREDSNHRYTTSTAIRTQMLAQGYLSEGHGPDGIVMCAVQ